MAWAAAATTCGLAAPLGVDDVVVGEPLGADGPSGSVYLGYWHTKTPAAVKVRAVRVWEGAGSGMRPAS
jgi:hypothetical protein